MEEEAAGASELAALRQPKAQDFKNTGQSSNSETKRYSEILRDFDKFELSLVPTSVDELLPDPDTQSIAETSETTENTDMDDVTSEEVYNTEMSLDVEEKEGGLSAQDADLALCRCEGGVEIALQYAKMWCRYAKDLLTWMDKRISLEQEFAKNITKAAETAKSFVAQQDMMPLQYIYTMALEHDVKTSSGTKHTAELLQQRCFQALAAKKNEIDKWRREFKEQWMREQKRMSDAETALKRARQQYIQRSDDLEKAKAVTAKAEEETLGFKTLDKKRKSKVDAQSKVTEAEVLYKQCLSDARARQEDLEKAKEKIIVHIRKLICQGDTVLKEATVNMFYYQRQQTEPVPLGYHNLELTCRPSEPGEPYLLYILRKRRREKPTQIFTFQEYIPHSRRSPSTSRRRTGNAVPSLHDSYTIEDFKRCNNVADARRSGYSDSESMGGSLESLSSPVHVGRRLPKVSSTGTMSSDDLDERDMGAMNESETVEADGNGPLSKVRITSQAVLTHRLRKMKSKMVKCKQCDNYILVNGIECEECGLSLHRRCLEVCQLECEHRKGLLFGVGFSLLAREQPEDVPFIVRRCTSEIESRALNVQGIYRVSGSKPRIQKLCMAFELQRDQVDLCDLSPHDITSALKHFFKELPEPLLTFDLYKEFLAVGKDVQRLSEREHATEVSGIVENIVLSLRELLRRLPLCNYSALQHMMLHLHRVSEHYEENKMSPGNLGIVFGPTLLRPLVSGDVSMIALLETSYQAMLVEFMISHYEQVFGPLDKPDTPPPPPPTAPLPDTPPRASGPPTQTSTPLERDASSRERPRSLETRTIKRDSSEGYISDKSSSNEAVDQLSPEANERAVLAMRGAKSAALKHEVGKPDPHLGAQPRGHFSRQPVKYQRQDTPAAGCTAACQAGGHECAGPKVAAQPRSADLSRGSSPEPGTPAQACPQEQNTTEAGRSLHKPAHAPEAQPCDSVKRLGLDEAVKATAVSGPISNHAVRLATGDRADQLTKLNSNQSNNVRRSGEAQVLGRSFPRQPREARTAQKILSGLRLRRSDSGKGEQLHFV